MDNPRWSYETTLAAEPVSVRKARAFVCRLLVDHGVAYLVDPVRLVVSELATNAMVFAPGSLTISLSGTDRSVRLAVRDDSPVQRVSAQVPRGDLSGRGRVLVQLISSDWGAVSDRPGSHTVWASFDLRITPAESPPSRPKGAQLERSQQ